MIYFQHPARRFSPQPVGPILRSPSGKPAVSLIATLGLFALLGLSWGAPSASADDLHYEQVSLHAEANRQVTHDRMEVSLYTEAEDKDPARLARSVTATLNQAVSRARQTQGIEVNLGSRSSRPIYDQDDKPQDRKKPKSPLAWRERAELRLTSGDFAALSSLTGDLLQSMVMGGMQFSVSDSSRKNSEDGLIEEAVAAFKKRAQIISKALGGSAYRLVRLDLNSTSAQPPRPLYAMAKMARSDGPVAPDVEGGSSTLSVSADGVIEVQMP